VPSTANFIAATNDPDLLARAQATAQIAGVPNAQQWVALNFAAICLHQGEDGQSIIDAHAYASATREQHIAATPPRAGINPGAVTDSMLSAAVEALRPQP